VLDSDLIAASTFEINQKTPLLAVRIINISEKLGLVQVTKTKRSKKATVSNFTLINLILVNFGPMTEQNLAIAVMLVQIICSIFAYIVRYGLVHVVYNEQMSS
jgi:UDP-N-acetylglucosamine--dolichyl-phosphate N-acetylglucosaminephosphotransferase